MKNILGSASKLVLLYIIGILGILALFAVSWAVATNTFGDMAKIVVEIFKTVITLVMGYYFGYKGETSGTTSGAITSQKIEATTTTEPVPPMAGK